MGTTRAVALGDAQLLRYNRQIMLPEIDLEGQQRLLGSRVVIFGLGGLGSPLAMYLATSGVGELVLVDPDRVELSNLQRQIVHPDASQGMAKVESARRTLLGLNPEVRVETHPRALEGEALRALIEGADLVADGTDRFAARLAINAACHATATPLVSAAVIRLEGQVSVHPFGPGYQGPCYACLYHGVSEPPASCAENGVLGPVAGIIGCIQATEAIKLLAGFGRALAGTLLLLDARGMDFERIRVPRNPDCPVCA